MKHRVSLTVPSYLCRSDDTLHIDGLAALMGEAAWQHARSFGVAFTEEEVQQFWILHRLGFRVLRSPRWGEEITIETWPSRVRRLFAMREFLISTDGETLVEASSAWIILDAATRRPVRPENHLAPDWRVEEVPLEMPTGKIGGIDEGTATALRDDARWYPVRESDIDRNGHVNNARYVQWLEDAAPATPDGITLVSFLAETHAGQEYTVIAGENGDPTEVWTRGGSGTEEQAPPVCAGRRSTLPTS